MAKRRFAESVFKYTDPIRFFKENDPIHADVDNIPLKQLQENDNFLKDQIESLLGNGEGLSVKRENFDELRPYVDGVGSVVKVKPGRYSARINDAYSADPLQFMAQVLGFSIPEFNTFLPRTNLDVEMRAILNKFKSNLAADALNTNGLLERTFTFGMQTVDTPSPYLSNIPGYTPALDTPPYPNVTGKLWRWNTNSPTETSFQFDAIDRVRGFFTIGSAESDLIKRWRGIARTAIVNVEEELEVSIPAFDQDDFYYINEVGERVPLFATQRIDLVFIYSKPIDAPSTTISKFVGNNPVVLTKPALGIVKGAGIGVNLRVPQPGQPQTNEATVPIVDENGTPLMLPSVADEIGENIGFSSIKGSFPSPDDLMNLSPLIAEDLTNNYYALIGQSILPVAYVVVRRNATLNSESTQILSESDLIDIRPFFRTTELSYNERVGIAAATPQISVVNPVASEGYVDYAVKQLYDDYTSKLTQVNTAISSDPQYPRIVATGYIKGGFNYGVEAALAAMVQAKFNVQNPEQQKQQIVSRYGYPQDSVIPDLPDWDISEWCFKLPLPEKGRYPNDYINFHTVGPNFNGTPGSQFGAWKNIGKTERIKFLGVNRIQGQQSNSDAGNVCIYFVKKSINIDRSLVGWMKDYHVDVQLWNCAPLTCNTHKDGNNIVLGGNASIWVDKRVNSFTIYVSWVAADQYNQVISAGSTEPGDSNVYPFQDRSNGSKFAGFTVLNQDFLQNNYVHKRSEGESDAGIAIYPTVTFQVHGIPAAFQSGLSNVPAVTQPIVLR